MAIRTFSHRKKITTIVRSVKAIVHINQRMPMIATNTHYRPMTMDRLNKMAFCKSHLHVIATILCCKISTITTHSRTNIRLMHQMTVTNMYLVMVMRVSKM
jgi:hypothetical protein